MHPSPLRRPKTVNLQLDEKESRVVKNQYKGLPQYDHLQLV